MGDVLDLIGVTVVRDGATLLEDVTWTVREGERWVVLGPNGAGKTTLLQIAGARMHPSRGSVDVLGDRLGEVDVFELRPRIGLSSAAFAETLPAGEKVVGRRPDRRVRGRRGAGVSATTSSTTAVRVICSRRSASATSRTARSAP